MPADRLESIVRDTWGHTTIRPLQRAAMDAVLSRQDTVLVLSTGGGKSLCYQAPALMLDGTTLVLSPLIALMKDQVDALRLAGVSAASIHSASTPAERMETRRLAEAGNLKLLYVAPERLVSDNFLDWLTERIPINLLAVDEAHCISTWGHDFRPEYRQISVLRKRLGTAPVFACTATATPKVADDICLQLGLKNPVRLTGSFDRPNFVYRVLPQRDSEARIRAIIRRYPGQAGIVYCLARKRTETLSAALQATGIRALPYHAGLDDNTRHQNHEAFLAGDCDVMVATVAFGMGIDKPDIRFIIHIGIPESLENYQQETGRAGRDGAPAECTLLFSYGDAILWRERAANSPPELAAILNARLQSMLDYAQTKQCRRRVLLQHFGENHPGNCNQCDCCRPSLADDGPLEPTVRRRRDTPQPATKASTTTSRTPNHLPTQLPPEKVSPELQIPQKILSHFARAKSSLTPEIAALALLGTPSEQITRLGHDQLTTFGLLRNQRADHLHHWIQQLYVFACLEPDQTATTHIPPTPITQPRLRITPKGWAVMAGREPLQLHYPAPLAPPNQHTPGHHLLGHSQTPTIIHHPPTTNSTNSTPYSNNPTPQTPNNPAPTPQEQAANHRFEILRHWRLELARQRKVSAFVILSDNVLKAIAKFNPANLEELAAIPGIGQSRLNQYGPLILQVLSHNETTSLPPVL